ncbi:MAG TPA: cytochrome c [Arsenicitalea sp.]|jgi:hypothetical protein|nr:cytochrome c [Arsenicitalea sp.]
MSMQGIALAAGADGYYTSDQAARGMADFNSNCSQCHGAQLEGGVGPSLKGTDFLGTWGTADGIYQYFSVAMPPTAPGKLGKDVYTDILAYILSVNSIPAGKTALGQDASARVAINLVAAAGSAPAAAAAPAAKAAPATGPGEGAMPQAFTFGKPLPTLQPDGSIAQIAPATKAGTAKPKAKPAVPQAFTFGKPLPGAPAAK